MQLHSAYRDAWRTLRGPRYAPLTLVVGTFVAASFVTRLGLLGMQRPADGWGAVILALAAGLLLDVTVALWLAAPLALYLSLATERQIGRRGHRGAMVAAVAGALLVALFVAAAEVVFFDEFNGRFNFVAVDYLIYPTEVVTNIWQSYPVAWMLAGIGAAAALVLWPAAALLRRSWGAPATAPSPRQRLTVAGGYALLLAALSLAASPSVARVSDDRALNEIAGNGYYSFWQALMGQDAPYDGLYASRPDSVVFPRLQRLLAEPCDDPAGFAPASTVRLVHGAAPRRRLNVVIVLEESLGSLLVGSLHPRDTSLTPHYDSLMREGVLLAHAYSTGNRTIRALEATTSSLPPLPGVSVVRRPASEGLFTLPAVLRGQGYATAFIYGGRALFDGMGSYMRRNGMERVVEQGDFPDTAFKTAWGVSDEYIFDRALAEMDSLHATGKPFYTLVLSVSNHKPYTYPAGRIAADPAKRRREHAVQYADWALGRFVRQARSHAFFDSTLFVLMGDHGARVYGASEIPLPSYEVPILLYAPALLPGGARVETLASSMDVPPTVLALLGLDYRSKFFGRDVLHEPAGTGRAPMTHNNEIALMSGGRVAVLGLKGATRLYNVDSAGAMHPTPSVDPAGRELIEDAIAYFQGADELYRRGKYRYE